MMKLTEQDWLKLRGYNKQISLRILSKLPGDWYLTPEDVEGVVYDAFIKILASYKPGAMSPTTYCYMYAEKIALQTLFKEYRRVKAQLPLDDIESPDDDENTEKLPPGEYKIVQYVDLATFLEDKDLVDQILTEAERHMFGEIADGLKTKTESEIAANLEISQPAVHKKIEKLRKLCENILK